MSKIVCVDKIDFDIDEVIEEFEQIDIVMMKDLIALKHLTPFDLGSTDLFIQTVSRMNEISKGNPGRKALALVLNAAYTQQREVFAFSRAILRDLVDRDTSDIKLEFSNSDYKKIVAHICKSGFVALIKQGQGRRPSLYQVCDIRLQRFFAESSNKQEKEALEFISKRSGGSEDSE